MTVTRIAPSPTGDPHIGTAYQALLNSVFAAQRGGKFIVRLEDTDRSRYNEASVARILDMLAWLGITPDASPRHEDDRGPYVQSQRLPIYREHAGRLLAEGKAYRAFDTPEELGERRKAAEARGDSYRGYDRRDRELSAEESLRRAEAGEEFVIRLKVPTTGETVVRDGLRGDVVFQNAELDDKVLLKRDGYPTYHLAAMVDDHLMGVTHVIRAEEWLVSTPIHVHILRAFGWAEPEWIHTPLLLAPGGRKYSKRHGDPTVEDLRREGVLPEALLNYLGTMGFSMPPLDGVSPEIFGLDQFREAFTFDRVSLGGSTFDPQRLRWVNAQYLRALPAEEAAARLHAHWREFGPGEPPPLDGRFVAAAALMQPRVELLGEFAPKVGYFFAETVAPDERAAAAIEKGREHLTALHAALAEVPEWRAEALLAAVKAVAAERGAKPGAVMPPLRAAVAGTMESPDLGGLLEALGRERVLARLAAVA